MSEQKHTRFKQRKIPHLDSGGTEGGKCLYKHPPLEKSKAGYVPNNSCSHRWQALKQALANKGLYAPKKEIPRDSKTWELLFRGGSAQKISKIPGARPSIVNRSLYFLEVPHPKEEEWEVSETNANFKWDCNTPYYHEAHHVVPDAMLRQLIWELYGPREGGSLELALFVIEGLLEVPYNVNHMRNMLILPMDDRVGDLIMLPIHRETQSCSHTAYDTYVKSLLSTAFMPFLRQILEEHDEGGEPPLRKDLAQALQQTSVDLYKELSEARGQGISSVEGLGRHHAPGPQRPSGA